MARSALAVNGASCLTYDLPDDAELDFNDCRTAGEADCRAGGNRHPGRGQRSGGRPQRRTRGAGARLAGVPCGPARNDGGRDPRPGAARETMPDFRRGTCRRTAGTAVGVQGRRAGERRATGKAGTTAGGAFLSASQRRRARIGCRCPTRNRGTVRSVPARSTRSCARGFWPRRERWPISTSMISHRGAEVSIFDAAVAAEGGLVALNGRHCFPWRLRKGRAGALRRSPLRAVRQPGDQEALVYRPGARAGRGDLAHGSRCERHRRSGPRPGILPLHGSAAPDRFGITAGPQDIARRKHGAFCPSPSIVSGAAPCGMPEIVVDTRAEDRGRRAIVTTMKNEGPFILEWLAYHPAPSASTMSLSTPTIAAMARTPCCSCWSARATSITATTPIAKFRCKPQHAALRAADGEALIRQAAWVTCIDVDEYINIKTGDGTLDALFAAVPEANMIAMTWRLFGNGDMHRFEDRPVTEQFRHCAPEFSRKPHQAWGFKTLFRKHRGCSRNSAFTGPRGSSRNFWEGGQLGQWIRPAPAAPTMYRRRLALDRVDLRLRPRATQFITRCVRTESFLVKRDRGRVKSRGSRTRPRLLVPDEQTTR